MERWHMTDEYGDYDKFAQMYLLNKKSWQMVNIFS